MAGGSRVFPGSKIPWLREFTFGYCTRRWEQTGQ